MISRLLAKYGLIPALCAAMVFSLSVSTDAARKEQRKKTNFRQKIAFNIQLETRYDDNVINYSDDDLDLYAGGANESKFAIDSKDDWIFIPRFEARIKGDFIGGHTAWLETYFRYNYYARNEVRRFYKLGVNARHYLFPSGYVEARYSLIPDYYYRNQFYRDASGNGTYIEANFLEHYIKLEYGMNLVPSLKGDISYRFESKSFNEEFSERDLTIHGMRLDGIWRTTDWIKFWLYYGLERAEAKGADIPDLDVKDVSYDAWDILFGVRYYSDFLGRIKPEFVSTFKYRRIKYQTLKYIDDYRFGRKDSNYYLRFGVAGRLPVRLRVEIDYNLVAKRVSLLDTSKEGLLEYDSNSVSVTLNRSF
jgi:hypothetical protein